MGCIVLGSAFMSDTACSGSFDRAWSSAVSSSHWALVGISPVNKSQVKASGIGSPSPAGPLKVGRMFCNSGIEWPRKPVQSGVDDDDKKGLVLTNSFVRVEQGRFPEHALDRSSASNALINGHLSELLVAKLCLERLQVSLFLRNLCRQPVLQRRHAPHATERFSVITTRQHPFV